jgi:hypothetical protein
MATSDSSKIDDFAEELGRLLGTAEAKAKGWLGQREQIAKTLEGIRDTATRLLGDLGHQAARAVRRGRPVGSKNAATHGPGRPKGSGKAGAPRKRRKMSAAARAKISAAQKKRWAKQKAEDKK